MTSNPPLKSNPWFYCSCVLSLLLILTTAYIFASSSTKNSGIFPSSIQSIVSNQTPSMENIDATDSDETNNDQTNNDQTITPVDKGEKDEEEIKIQPKIRQRPDDKWVEVEAEVNENQSDSIDPNLIENDEGEALQSNSTKTTIDDLTLEEAKKLAIETNDPSSKISAINAISESETIDKEMALIEVFSEVDEEYYQLHIVKKMNTNSLHSTSAAWMVEQLYSQVVAESVKKEIAKNLIMAGLIENKGGTNFAQSLYDQVPFEAQKYLKTNL